MRRFGKLLTKNNSKMYKLRLCPIKKCILFLFKQKEIINGLFYRFSLELSLLLLLIQDGCDLLLLALHHGGVTIRERKRLGLSHLLRNVLKTKAIANESAIFISLEGETKETLLTKERYV